MGNSDHGTKYTCNGNPNMAGCALQWSSSSSSLLSSPELSATQVHESSIRARLGTAAPFCKVVLKLRTLQGSRGGGGHVVSRNPKWTSSISFQRPVCEEKSPINNMQCCKSDDGNDPGKSTSDPGG